MKKWLALAVLATALALIPVAHAGGGGFCSGYEGERITDAAGNRVSMSKNCFGPTVLRVQRGQTVRFVNKDPEPHAVGGAAGSFGDMHKSIAPGHSIAFEFERDGVFPYVCTFHPGMAGAVVVGDGVGSIAGGSVASPVSAADSLTEPPPADRGGNERPALAPPALAVVAVSALTALLLRRHRRRAELGWSRAVGDFGGITGRRR
jgi:plastocyanin